MQHSTQKSGLQQAYDVLLRARQLGAEPDLCEAINCAMSHWRDPDRAWRLKNPLGTINSLATELSRLTGADIEVCLETVKEAQGDSETAARIDAMLEFGKQLASARRRSA